MNKEIYKDLCNLLNDNANIVNTSMYEKYMPEYRENSMIIRARIITNSNRQYSIQASSYHYCNPRLTLDDFTDYRTVELGVFFGKNEAPNALKHLDFDDKSSDQNINVLSCVSIEDLVNAIEEEGGIKDLYYPLIFKEKESLEKQRKRYKETYRKNF